MKYFLICIILTFVLLLFNCRKAPSSHRQKDHKVELVEYKNNFEKNYHSISDSRDADIVSNEELELPLVKISDGQKILRRRGYTTLYDKELKIPRWVAWHLPASHVDGIYSRYKTYYEDEDVPLPRATNEDYKGTKWSRGHMCPAGDNKWDEKAMFESNLLTNICPQHKELNSGIWNAIERKCRIWANKYGDLFIVCGPIFLNDDIETIGQNRVAIPDAFFKVTELSQVNIHSSSD